MIWIKEKDKIVGYVPMLKKEYSDDQIREMSKYCYSEYKGWSKLSGFVMHLQGISYAFIGYKPTTEFFEAPFTLYDVTCDFDYECFWPFSDLQIELYIKQLFDVFENLTLYKVEQYSISDVNKQVDEMTDYLSHFVNEDIISSVHHGFKNMLSTADKNAKHLENLFELFSDNELVLSHNLFEEADNALIEKLKQPRENLRTERLVKSIHY